MNSKKNLYWYIKELFNLAIPMILGSLGMILIGAGDVFVAARHSTQTLACVSIANSIISTIFLFGIGIIVSISPLLSNFRGARQEIKKYLIPTLLFASIIAIFSTLIILGFIPIIDHLKFPRELVPDIKKYMLICAFSTFGAYLQASLKEYLQAFEIVIFPNLLNIFGVFLNLFLNFTFVFGWFGLPEMGAVGLAIATLLSRSILGISLLLYCMKFVKIRYHRDFDYFLKLLAIGFPIAIAITLEVGAFNIITIIVGRISGIYAAAQNILLTITTATFMIPMAIANAIAVKVGFANGARNYTDLKKYTLAGITVSVTFMSLCALLFIFTPKTFINIFTKDTKLIEICIPILILAGFFQIFDGLQVSLGGVFKGLKKTKIVMLGSFIAFWIIGLPLGIFLAFKFKMELFGFWIGITLAIIAVAAILLGILISYFKKIKKMSQL